MYPDTEKRRRLLKDGIHVDKIRYWSDVLSRDLGRGGEMLVKYDQRDLSRIFVRRADGHYIEARYRNLAYPAVTLWERRNAKRRLFTQGRRDLNEETPGFNFAPRSVRDRGRRCYMTTTLVPILTRL
jgi:putative transposase